MNQKKSAEQIILSLDFHAANEGEKPKLKKQCPYVSDVVKNIGSIHFKLVQFNSF